MTMVCTWYLVRMAGGKKDDAESVMRGVEVKRGLLRKRYSTKWGEVGVKGPIEEVAEEKERKRRSRFVYVRVDWVLPSI